MTQPITAIKRALRRRYGAWLKERRDAAGLTQLQVARAIGYKDGQSVWQIERGVSALPSRGVAPLAQRFGVPSEEFAKRHTYFLLPTVYEAMFDEDPIALEGLVLTGGADA